MNVDHQQKSPSMPVPATMIFPAIFIGMTSDQKLLIVICRDCAETADNGLVCPLWWKLLAITHDQFHHNERIRSRSVSLAFINRWVKLPSFRSLFCEVMLTLDPWLAFLLPRTTPSVMFIPLTTIHWVLLLAALHPGKFEIISSISYFSWDSDQWLYGIACLALCLGIACLLR